MEYGGERKDTNNQLEKHQYIAKHRLYNVYYVNQNHARANIGANSAHFQPELQNRLMLY